MAKKAKAANKTADKTAAGKTSVPKAKKAPQQPAPAKAAKVKPAKRTPAPRAAKSGNSKAAPPVAPAAETQPQYASLDEARSATLDALLAVIEDAEERLTEAKHADSIERLQQLGKGRV